MTDIGHKLISELHGPTDLVEYARLAEGSNFDYAMLSDHYHPWLPQQGESPMVWNVIGAIAEATDDLRLGTGVTCPTTRIHPAIVAQAAATAGVQLPGRFFLGVGTGENLSEHVLGDRWPEHAVRLAMLEEALEVIRTLWEGETTSYHGEYYTVENARLFTLPEERPSIPVAADGPKTAHRAGEIGDGLIAVEPDADLVEIFRDAGGEGKPVYGEVAVCYDEDEQEAVERAHDLWTQEGLPGELLWDLPTPAHFAQATEAVSEDDVAALITCGPDPDEHVETVQQFVDAGFDHVTVHQIGSNQADFLEFYEDEVLPAID